MKAISRFVGTTILGGVLFLTPIVVLAFVLSKAFEFVSRGLQPVTALIPERLASAPTMTAVLAILVLAILCFLAGLFARTHLAQRFVRGLEGSVLSKLPGYEYLKQAGTSVLGFGETAEHPVVLAHLGGAWRIGVQTDHVGEDLVAVFVPNSPNPLSGSVFFVAADRVRPLEGSLASAIACLRRCGMGSGTLLAEPPRRVGARIRNRLRLVVSRGHEGIVDRGRLVEAVAGETVRGVAGSGSPVRIEGQRIRMHGDDVARPAFRFDAGLRGGLGLRRARQAERSRQAATTSSIAMRFILSSSFCTPARRPSGPGSTRIVGRRLLCSIPPAIPRVKRCQMGAGSKFAPSVRRTARA